MVSHLSRQSRERRDVLQKCGDLGSGRPSALVEGEDPAHFADIADQYVEHDLLGAVEAEIGRLPDAVLDPHVRTFPEEIPDSPGGKLELDDVARRGDLRLV